MIFKNHLETDLNAKLILEKVSQKILKLEVIILINKFIPVIRPQNNFR